MLEYYHFVALMLYCVFPEYDFAIHYMGVLVATVYHTVAIMRLPRLKWLSVIILIPCLLYDITTSLFLLNRKLVTMTAYDSNNRSSANDLALFLGTHL